MRTVALLLSCAIAGLAAPPPKSRSLAAAIDLLLESPLAKRTTWGIQVVDLASGKTIYERAPAIPLAPASNTKLFSTALALVRLGPFHTFPTFVMATQAVDGSGTVHGDLALVGGGDPTLNARPVPYHKGPAEGNPFRAIEELADRCVEQGLRRVAGDLVGDDTLYPASPRPDGWTVDDSIFEYGAPVGALMVNDNSILLRIRPGEAEGDAAVLSFDPSVEPFTLQNYVTTASASAKKPQISLERTPGALRVSGAIRIGKTDDEDLSVEDGALFAAQAFADALRRRGVVIDGRVIARHRLEGTPYEPTSGVELTHRHSPPLGEILQTIDKVSMNLHAEIVLRETGRVRRGDATLENGLEELKSMLQEMGAPVNGFDFYDASGLSRLGLVSPETVVRLLVQMHRSPYRNLWWDLMPIGGQDGTLEHRFAGMKLGAAIHAKTGSMRHVNALSGYAGLDPRRRLAFSIIANNSIAPASEIRAIIDRIAVEIAKRATP
jgi:D-alanyl-D-alanine carboxypeptidase/D-alanyl-D-alanine-endopeptidase (penicillin-binding protein 4)